LRRSTGILGVRASVLLHLLGHGDQCQVPTSDVGQVLGLVDLSFGAPEDHVALAEQDLPLGRVPRVLDDVGERVEQADDHRRHPAACLAHLVEGTVDHARIARIELDQPDPTEFVPVDAFTEHPSGDLAEPGGEPVDAGECRERVVDCR